MKDLKNCPFCGSDNVDQVMSDTAFVRCQDCGARGPQCGDGGAHTDFIDRLRAIDLWNNRKRAKN